MADLGFLPVVRRLLARTPARRPAHAVLGHARQGDRRARAPVPEPAEDPPGRLGAGDDRDHEPPRPARTPRAADPRAGRPDQRSGPQGRVHPHQARRPGPGPAAQPQRRADRRPARQPQPGCADPQHGGLPLRPGHHARRHRRRRPRHPRRRRGARRARRPAVRAQGLPAPLRPHGARRRRGHRRHADDRRAGPRGARPDARGRRQRHHDQGRRVPPTRCCAAWRRARARSPGGFELAAPVAQGTPRKKPRRGPVLAEAGRPQRQARPSGGRNRGRRRGQGGAAAKSGQSRPHSAASFSSRAR